MSEWWTYRPSDFLMFSPRIYWRLFEALNLDWWPLQPAWTLLALTWLGGRVWRWRGDAMPATGVPWFAAAAAWALVAADYLAHRFAPIHTAVPAFVVLWALQAAALLLPAVRGRLRPHGGVARRRAALALLGWALVAHPLLPLVAGRPWVQAEVTGLAPDPTAIATLGLLLAATAEDRAGRRVLRALWLAPLLWCAISAATLATMDDPQALVPAAAALVALGAAWRDRRA